MAQNPTGRRLGERTAKRQRGTILADNNAVTDVYVLDQSTSGLRLELPLGVAIDRRFTIRISGNLSEAEVVWRRGFEVGARFVRSDEEDGRTKPAPPIMVKKISLAELRGLARK